MNWTPWRRNQDTSSVPAEVQEYYQSERRERVGVAWLLAIGTLLATLAVVIGLFFGGRWVLQKIAGDDDKKTPSTAQNQNQSGTGSDSNTKTNDDFNTGPITPNNGGSSTGTSSTSTPSGANPGSSGNQSSSDSTLVNTGPGDETGL